LIRHLIWDFDGSLFNTYPAMVQLFKSSLESFGYEATEDDILSLMKDTLGRAVSFYIDLGVDEGFYKLFQKLEDEVAPGLQPPFPNAKEICTMIKDRGGKNIIITHRSRKSVFKLLYHYSMEALFSEIIAKESGFKRKPHPEAFVSTLASQRLKPEEVLTIGDRDLDVIAASDAGTRTCFFSQNGSRPSIKVDYLITDLSELLEIL